MSLYYCYYIQQFVKCKLVDVSTGVQRSGHVILLPLDAASDQNNNRNNHKKNQNNNRNNQNNNRNNQNNNRDNQNNNRNNQNNNRTPHVS